MSVKLGPDWRLVKEDSFTWPTTGMPCKEVFRHVLFKERLKVYYNENGQIISSNANKFFFPSEVKAMFGNG